MIWLLGILGYLFVALVVAARLIHLGEHDEPVLVCTLGLMWPLTLVAFPLVFLAHCFYGAARWLSRR